MTGLSENHPKRGIPDALVMTTDLGAVGFCYRPESHWGKHPKGTFVVRLTTGQMDEIRGKSAEGEPGDVDRAHSDRPQNSSGQDTSS